MAFIFILLFLVQAIEPSSQHMLSNVFNPWLHLELLSMLFRNGRLSEAWWWEAVVVFQKHRAVTGWMIFRGMTV
jgi:hypothetical protein